MNVDYYAKSVKVVFWMILFKACEVLILHGLPISARQIFLFDSITIWSCTSPLFRVSVCSWSLCYCLQLLCAVEKAGLAIWVVFFLSLFSCLHNATRKGIHVKLQYLYCSKLSLFLFHKNIFTIMPEVPALARNTRKRLYQQTSLLVFFFS